MGSRGLLAAYQTEAGVEGLLQDGVARVEDELGEEDLIASLVDLCSRTTS